MSQEMWRPGSRLPLRAMKPGDTLSIIPSSSPQAHIQGFFIPKPKNSTNIAEQM
jgi:hypothetical protein